MLDSFVVSSLKMVIFFVQHFLILHDVVLVWPRSNLVPRVHIHLVPFRRTKVTQALGMRLATFVTLQSRMRTSLICYFKSPSNMLQHFVTGWPNVCNIFFFFFFFFRLSIITLYTTINLLTMLFFVILVRVSTFQEVA